jgi:hypothetical protein
MWRSGGGQRLGLLAVTSKMSDLHETDVVAWSDRQSALLRRVAAGEQVIEHIDWANIIDEVEAVGRSERGALQSHVATVIEHLIKLQASPAAPPAQRLEGSDPTGAIRYRGEPRG